MFQVDYAKVLHYVGAGVAFPTSILFVCLQSALTYRLAKTQREYNMGHLRLGMSLLAFITLVFSILYTGRHCKRESQRDMKEVRMCYMAPCWIKAYFAYMLLI